MLTAHTQRGDGRRGHEGRRVRLRHEAVRPGRRGACACRARSKPRGCGANCARCAIRWRGPYGVASIIGESEPMQRVKQLVRKVASSPGSTVLLMGESGTGKDLVAKVIHYLSSRAARPFLNITCSALPEALLESELFGHERGAFTDARAAEARAARAGRRGHGVPRRDRRDDAGACRRSCCACSRRRRSGASAAAGDIHVDVRVIAATNRDLEEHVQAPAGSARTCSTG